MSGWKCVMVLITATAFALALPCNGGEPTREARIEAAFIYNFTQFVEWPADAFAGNDAPFVVAVVGDDPFGGALEHALAGKVVNGRSIAIRYFPSADRIEQCHLLFIPASQDAAAGAIMSKIGTAAILTVGESDSIMPAGGAIRLFLEEGRMRFQIAPEAVDATRLKASAKLMKLGRIYRK